MKADFLRNDENSLTADSLGWTQFLNTCANHLCLNYDTELTKLFPFFTSASEIKASHSAVELLLSNSNYIDDFSTKLRSIAPYLNIDYLSYSLNSGVVLTYKEINGICLAFEALKIITRTLHNNEVNIIKFDKHEIANFLHKHILKIRKFILDDFNFNLKEDKQLKALVDQRDQVIKKIVNKVQGFLKGNNELTVSASSLDVFDGVYLLPVPASEYSNALGTIEKRSNTGNTFYVNLNSITKLNNNLQEIHNAIEKHIFIYEKRITESLREDYEQLIDAVSILKQLDLYLCKAKIADELQLRKPEFAKEFNLQLSSMHHPFIENYVSNTLDFSRDHSVFLITGSNYGGKSVFLKTVAFCSLLNQAGFYVPTNSSVIPALKKLFYFSGDLQDYKKSESSFSAETKYYLKILDELEDGSILFLDEIFSSTSSLEGSSLAFGLIKTIIEKYKKVKILVTTHHELLKDFLSNLEKTKFGCFSVDHSTGLPNFKLIPDKIESSRAIETFSRIFAESSELDNIISAAKSVSKIDRQQSQLQSREQVELDQLKEKFKKLQQEFNLLNDLAEKNVSRSSERVKVETVKDMQQIKSSFENEMKEVQIKKDQINDNDIGKSFYSTSLSTKVKLVEIGKDFYLVQNKAFKIKVPIFDLSRTKQPKPDNIKKQYGPTTVEFTSTPELKVDGRGMRLDEFTAAVDLQLNHLYAGNIPFLEIIHGHGTGVLKTWLLKMISDTPDLVIEAREDGNDGSTVVKLK